MGRADWCELLGENMATTARFWDWVNGGWVKITLRAGQVLSRTYGGPTDEGYSRTWERWEFDGAEVEYECCTEGRDCDGRHESGCTVVAWVSELAIRIEGHALPIPNWRKESAHQRDHTAEAAGY